MAIDPNIKKKADDIRNKIYGKEVRESLASGLEEMSSDVVETVGRQDDVESQWQNVVDETTGKDVISAPEIIAARNGEADLKARLDKEHQEVTTQLAQNAKDVRIFGAVGDGVTDDTNAIQNALDTKGNILISNGVYLVDGEVGLDVESNTRIVFKNAKLISTGTSFGALEGRYEVMRIIEKENIEIIRPIIVGERELHRGTSGEWGHGLTIMGSKDIKIHNPNISDCWGDGIYLGTSNGIVNRNVEILGVTNIKNCRRQGISVISGIDCYIEHLQAKDINGTDPMGAIDFEPNTIDDVIKNFIVGSITATRCFYGAIFVPRREGSLDIKIGSINVLDCTQPLRFAQQPDGLHKRHGTIEINNIYVDKVADGRNPILINSWTSDYSPQIIVDRFVVGELMGERSQPALIQFYPLELNNLTDAYGGFTFNTIILNKASSTVDVCPLYIRRGVPKTKRIENIIINEFLSNVLNVSMLSVTDFSNIVNCKLHPYKDMLKARRGNEDLSTVVIEMKVGDVKTIDYDSSRSGYIGYPSGRGIMIVTRHTTRAMFLVFDESANKLKQYSYNLNINEYSDVVELMTQTNLD